MADACPNCGVWLGNEPLPNDSAWERLQAEVERLRELITEWDAAHTAWLSPPGRAPIGAAESRRLRLHAAEDALTEEARRER